MQKTWPVVEKTMTSSSAASALSPQLSPASASPLPRQERELTPPSAKPTPGSLHHPSAITRMLSKTLPGKSHLQMWNLKLRGTTERTPRCLGEARVRTRSFLILKSLLHSFSASRSLGKTPSQTLNSLSLTHSPCT